MGPSQGEREREPCGGAGLELGAISLATVPVTAAWLALALALGRAHERRTRDPLLQDMKPPMNADERR